MKNKKIIILACALSAFVACAGTTYAYLSKTLNNDNAFTTGYCDAILTETGSIPENVPSGETFVINDEVCVLNTGNLPCYVRVAIDFDSNQTENKATIVGKDSKWIYKDGFYYYTQAIAPGDSTEPIFTSINIEALSEAEAEDFGMGVYSEAIDSVNETGYESAWENYLGTGTAMQGDFISGRMSMA